MPYIIMLSTNMYDRPTIRGRWPHKPSIDANSPCSCRAQMITKLEVNWMKDKKFSKVNLQ